MNGPSRLATALGLCAIIALALFYAGRTPAIVPASAPATEFSAERAMAHVRQIAQRPHPVGSADHRRVREYVAGVLTSHGVSLEIQETTAVGTRYAVAGRVWNVIGRLEGTARARPVVLLVTHYDGVPGGPAAGDDAAATAALLETVRALKAGPPLRNDVLFLITDGEEAGLLGAAAFVREHPAARDVAIVMNFEARGTSGPSLMFETGPGNLDAVRMLRGSGGPRASSLSTAVYRRLPNDTDMSEFALLDKPGLNFAFIGNVTRYHTSQDDPDHLDQGSLQHHGQQMLALARKFGDATLPRPVTSDAVFFDLPLIGVVLYPEGWSVVFAVIAVGLLVVAVLRVRRDTARLWSGVALGAVIMLVAVAVGGVLAMGIVMGLERLHEALASGRPMWNQTYAAAIAATVVAVTTFAYVLTRRIASAGAIRIGVLLVWTVLAVALVVVAPGASFLLLWPVLLASAALVAETLLAGRSPARHVPLWLATLVGLFFLVPTTYLMVCLALGIGTMGGVILAVLTGLGTWLLAPHLEQLSTRSASNAPGETRLDWRLPAVTAAVALILLVAGAVTERTTVNNPAGVVLQYVVDPDSSRAWLTGGGRTPGAERWVMQQIREIRGDRPVALTRLVRNRVAAGQAAAVPFVAVASPFATIVKDSASADARRLTLRVRPGVVLPGEHASAMMMSLPRDAVISAEVDGRPISTERYRARSRTRWRLEYVAPADSGFLLTLTLQKDRKAELDLETHVMTIPPLDGVRLPQLPPGLVTIQEGFLSTAYRRLVF